MATALITGASGGIGAEMARILAARGDSVILVARSKDKLEALAAELGGAHVIVGDLSEPGAVAPIVAKVPDVDILINNAGVGDYGWFAKADHDATMRMVQLNVAALTELTRHYLPGMLDRGSGKVMNVASTAAFQPGPKMAVYFASKAYVLSFSEAIAEECRGKGVTVTCLCPGTTESDFWGGTTSGSPLTRLPKPTSKDVAEFGIKAMDDGKVVAVHGLANQLQTLASQYTPRPLVRRLSRFVQSR